MTVYKLKTPISEEDVRKLKVNDVLYVTGTIVTARDQAHRRALEFFKEGKPLPVNLEGLAVFHCGPVVSKRGRQVDCGGCWPNDKHEDGHFRG